MLGLYVLYHAQVELSRCAPPPQVNIRSLMSETLSPPCVLWASAGHGKVEMAGGDQLGEGHPS